jgi:Holliday junction resolvasome RuvABC endonuclease subunit
MMTRLTIIALDLGTTTGWAIRTHDGVITCGTQSFKSNRFEGGGMRYLRFRRWLNELKATLAAPNGPGAVYFEEVRRHLGVDAAHAYGGFLATLSTWCEHHNIPYQGVPVGTIKKHATGKGNASKVDMTTAMVKLGFAPTDDNEADALALLQWALTHEGELE